MSKRQKAKQKGNVLLLIMPCLLINWAFSRAVLKTKKLCHIHFDSLKGEIVTNINWSDYLSPRSHSFSQSHGESETFTLPKNENNREGGMSCDGNLNCSTNLKFTLHAWTLIICWMSPFALLLCRHGFVYLGFPDENEFLRGKFIL